MMRRITQFLSMVAIGGLVPVLGRGQTLNEGFNANFRGSYDVSPTGNGAEDDVTISGSSWRVWEGLAGNQSNDRFNGSYGVRLRNAGIVQMNFNKAGGAGTVSVLAARYGTDASGSFRFEASTDNGATWASTSPTFSVTTTTLTAFSWTANLTGNVRVRIVKFGGSERMNIDDLTITDAVAAAPFSGVTAGAGAEPATLSSLINTQAGAVANFDFTVTDDANTTSGNDALPTLISQIVVSQGTGNDIANWMQAIDGAELSDGTNTVSGTVGATSITFSGISTATLGNIADDASKTYTLKVWLKTALGGSLATTIDGLNLAFLVNRSSFTTAAAATSTQFETGSGTPVESGAGSNEVAVVATALNFTTQPAPTTVSVNANFTTPAVVRAQDANGNTDLNFSSAVTLTNSQNLGMANAPAAFVNGLLTFPGNFQFTTSATAATVITVDDGDPATANASSAAITVNAPAPAIAVTGYANNSLFSFGNVNWGASADQTFTIVNGGSAALTITGAAVTGNGYSIQGSVPTSIAAGISATITVRFAPQSTGPLFESLVISSNATPATYTINLSGTGTPNAASDIAANNAFAYPQNIAYAGYQAADITGGAGDLEVAQLVLRDGGAAANDADDLGTTLTSLNLNLSNSAGIRRVALYDGATELAETAGAASLSFTGLNLTAPDNGSKTFSIRVSFNSTVTDNQQFAFSVSGAATGAGSGFAAANAGTAATSTAADNNRIEVSADRIVFATQPQSASVSTNLAPFVIAAADANGNTDLDAAQTIALSTSGTSLVSSTPYSLSAGTLTVSDVQFSAAQNGITLTATTTGLASNSAVSNPFSIITQVFAIGDFRTTSAGTWPSSGTATWERFNGTSWVTQTPGPSTTGTLYIRHAITTNASFAAALPGTNLVVENNGSFQDGHTSTFASLLVKTGGRFIVADDAVGVNSTSGTLTVENGGTLVLNSASIDNSDPIWAGTENFGSGSTVEVQAWNYGASGSARRLVGNPSRISANAAGYLFGNLRILGAPTAIFSMVDGNQTISLCENDFTSHTTGGSSVTFTVAAAQTTVGGNVIVNSNQLSMAAANGGLPLVTVNGNLVLNAGTININQNNSSATSFVNLKGNLVANAGSIISTDADGGINFTGTGIQSIDVKPAVTISNTSLNIAAGAVARIVNQDLVLTNSSVALNVAGTLEFGTSNGTALNVTGAGSLTQAAGGVLGISSPAGISSGSAASGNVQTAMRNYNAGGTFRYIGGPGQVTGNGIPTTAANLVVANTNGLSLSQNLTITGNATFVSGIVNPGASLLTFDASASVSGASDASYVAGPVTKTGSAAFTFPIGKDGMYRPVAIANLSGSDAFTAEYFQAMPVNGGNLAPGPFHHVSYQEYWDVSRSGSATADITLSWNSLSQVFAPADIRVAHYNAATSSWENLGGTVGNGTVTATGVSSFSPFTLGTLVAGNPLPLQLLSFSGREERGTAKLAWTSTCEERMEQYMVERSVGGSAFQAIANLAAGNKGCSGQAGYEHNDAGLKAGASYQYRLRMDGLDGSHQYSHTVRIQAGDAGSQPLLLANPVGTSLQLAGITPGDAVRISDLSGRILLQWTAANSGSFDVSSLQPGNYFLTVQGASTATLRFVKQ